MLLTSNIANKKDAAEGFCQDKIEGIPKWLTAKVKKLTAAQMRIKGKPDQKLR
jgi:hypothetical protein